MFMQSVHNRTPNKPLSLFGCARCSTCRYRFECPIEIQFQTGNDYVEDEIFTRSKLTYADSAAHSQGVVVSTEQLWCCSLYGVKMSEEFTAKTIKINRLTILDELQYNEGKGGLNVKW